MHRNENVVAATKLPSPAALEVIILTTSSVASDGNLRNCRFCAWAIWKHCHVESPHANGQILTRAGCEWRDNISPIVGIFLPQQPDPVKPKESGPCFKRYNDPIYNYKMCFVIMISSWHNKITCRSKSGMSSFSTVAALKVVNITTLIEAFKRWIISSEWWYSYHTSPERPTLAASWANNG